MALKYSHRLLLVDDEASILNSLKRLFRRKKYEILTASNGRDALEILRQSGDTISLIISDQRMPVMTGSLFLEEAVGMAPNAIRFLLTGYADLDAVTDAVNKGKIHRYITKPWDDDEILEQVQLALDQVELRLENQRLTELTERQNAELARLNKDLEKKVQERTWALQVQNKILKGSNLNLEKSLMSSIRLLTSLVEYSNAQLGHYMQETAQLAKDIAIAAALDEKAQNDIEMAGLVHDIGLLGMSGSIVGKDIKIMNKQEFESFSQHPMVASLSLASIDGFKQISEIILCHHEWENGNGFPRKLKSGQIPMGAKILAVAADYCTILYLWPNKVRDLMIRARRYLDRDIISMLDITDEVVKMEIAEEIILNGAGQRYNPSVVQAFMKTIEHKRPRPKILHLSALSLKAGMILMQDLRLKDGRLLLSKGTVLNERCIQSIKNIGYSNLPNANINVTLPCNEETQETAYGT